MSNEMLVRPKLEGQVMTPAAIAELCRREGRLPTQIEMRVIDAFKTKQAQFCLKCDKPESTMICSKCNNARYCSSDCQRAHWADHKIKCSADRGEDERKEIDSLADLQDDACSDAVDEFVELQSYSIEQAMRAEMRLNSLDELANFPNYHENRVLVINVGDILPFLLLFTYSSDDHMNSTSSTRKKNIYGEDW